MGLTRNFRSKKGGLIFFYSKFFASGPRLKVFVNGPLLNIFFHKSLRRNDDFWTKVMHIIHQNEFQEKNKTKQNKKKKKRLCIVESQSVPNV